MSKKLVKSDFFEELDFTMNKHELVGQLNDIITNNFRLHKNNQINLADFMIGMIVARTVNLNTIASYSCRSGHMKQVNIYRGFQYVMHNFKMTQEQLALAILTMYGLNGDKKLTLALDRTNWQYGDKDINLLVLSVIVNGCGIPLYWIELDSRGNSDTNERKEVFKKLIYLVGADRIDYLLADREFIGEEWFDYLCNQNIKFVIRIKSNMLIKVKTGTKDKIKPQSGKILSAKATKNNVISFDGEINDRALSFQATISADNKLVLVASNDVGCQHLLQLYSKRWGIECLFGNLKSKGFNFEDTRITDKKRIGNLTKLLVLAFACTLLLGIVKAQYTPILVKKHGYKQHSYFRYGLDFITGIIMQDFETAIEILGLCLYIANGYSKPTSLKSKLESLYV